MNTAWQADPKICWICPRCGCPVQRMPNGTLAEGIAQHRAIVHPRTGSVVQ